MTSNSDIVSDSGEDAKLNDFGDSEEEESAYPFDSNSNSNTDTDTFQKYTNVDFHKGSPDPPSSNPLSTTENNQKPNDGNSIEEQEQDPPNISHSIKTPQNQNSRSLSRDIIFSANRENAPFEKTVSDIRNGKIPLPINFNASLQSCTILMDTISSNFSSLNIRLEDILKSKESIKNLKFLLNQLIQREQLALANNTRTE